MNTSGGNEKHITGFYLQTSQRINDASICDLGCVLLGADLLAESQQDRSTRKGIHDIPHFCLPEFAMTLTGKLVVGMYLDGKVTKCIYEFHKQRELGTMDLRNTPSHQLFPIFCNKPIDSITFQRAVFHNRFTSLYSTDFPTLANSPVISGHTFQSFQTVAAPYNYMKIIFK